MNDVIATIPKTDRAEVRVRRTCHKMRACIDIRLWYVPRGQTEYVASRKGVTFDAEKIPALVAALVAELP